MRTKYMMLILFSIIAPVSFGGEELLRTTTTWEGGEIRYPKGKPEVTAVKLSLAEGETAPFHCHPVPTFGYVSKGTAEIETRSGKIIRLHEGDTAVEVLRTVHRGRAVDGPVEIIAFYAGAKSVPNTVLPENDPEGRYCRSSEE